MAKWRLPSAIASLIDANTPFQREILFDRTNNDVRFGDGETIGGISLARKNGRFVTEFGAKGNCTGVGLGTDDAAAIRRAFAWWTSASDQTLIFPSGFRFRVGSDCTANFSALRGNRLIMNSPITPDPTAMKAFTICNGYDIELKLRCYQGGQDADYTLPDPSGDCTAFTLRGMRNPKIDIVGRGFSGRLLRAPVKDSAEPKFSFASMSVSHEGSAATPIGQPYYIDCASDAFGDIPLLYGLYGKYGGKVIDVSDISIGRMSTGDSTATSGVDAGAEFRGCVSLWIDTFDFGDISNNIVGNYSENTATALTIQDNSGSGHASFNVHIKTAFLNTPGVGLKIKNVGVSNAAYPGIHINHLTTHVSQTCGLDIENSRVIVDLHDSRSDAQPLKIGGAAFKDSKINCAYRNATGTAIEVATGVDLSATVFTGYIREACTADDTKPVVKITDSLSRVTFDNFTNYSDKGSYNFDLPSGNAVHIYSGQVAIGSGGAAFSNRAKRVNDLAGYRTRSHFTAVVANGTATTTGVAHNCAVTPTLITVQSYNENYVGFVSKNAGATTFDIVRDSVVGTDVTVDCTAFTAEEFG